MTEEQHIVEVEEGKLRGYEKKYPKGKEFITFLGVPYAEPPIKDLRFKAPTPKKPWTGVLDAKDFGSQSLQLDQISQKTVGSEDCLFLNIFTPKVRTGDLPVLVYIHGGGFVYGSGNAAMMNPETLLQNDIVFVSINYRLGVLGFLCLDTPDVPGNAGLKDQNLALKWIAKNIQNFGGDPNNITITGISAGSASVEFQILSPLSKGLFHKAILQSGTTLNPWARTRDPSYINKKLLTSLNISEDDDTLKNLQNLEGETLVKAALGTFDDKCERNGEIFPFVTVVEKPNPGAFLDREPIDILKSGNYNHVPTIVGYCDNEGMLFRAITSIFTKPDLSSQDFIKIFPKCLMTEPEDIVKSKLDKLYVRKNLHSDDSADEYLSDFYFVGGIYTALKARLSFGDEIYFYTFKYDGSFNFVKKYFQFPKGIKGALHGDDTSYLGGCDLFDESEASETDFLVRNNLTGMWTNFAKSGNPTPPGSSYPTWKPTTSEELELLVIDGELSVGKFNWIERAKFWEKCYLGRTK